MAAGVLEVLDEKRVRGTVERTYRLPWHHAEIDPADRAAMTTDDHRRTLTAFVGGLLASTWPANRPTPPSTA